MERRPSATFRIDRVHRRIDVVDLHLLPLEFFEVAVRASVKKEIGATEAVDSLIRKGCKRNLLLGRLALLMMARFSKNTWVDLTGYDPPRMKRLTRKLRKCADQMQVVNRSLAGRSLIVRNVSWSAGVPDELRKLANLYEHLVRTMRPKRRPALAATKKLLVKYVRQSTGGYYDREVSQLISAALNKSAYDEFTHRTWRHDHNVNG